MTLIDLTRKVNYHAGQYSGLKKTYCLLAPGPERDRVRGLMLNVAKKYSAVLAERRKLLTLTTAAK